MEENVIILGIEETGLEILEITLERTSVIKEVTIECISELRWDGFTVDWDGGLICA